MPKTNWLCKLLIGFAAIVFFAAGTARAGTCPPLGFAADCNVLITINPNGNTTITNPDPNPYDGDEDVYVGVLNNDPNLVVNSISLSGIGIFHLDDDGAFSGGNNCNATIFTPPFPCGSGGGTTGGPFDNGYASAGVNFSAIVLGDGFTTNDTGTALFLNGGLAFGQLGLFSLEGSPSGITLTGVSTALPGYFTTYYSANQANAPDETLRIINDGSGPVNPLYASIYVFDDSEELTQCCSCAITSDGLLSESVKLNLTANSIRGIVNTRGVIKVIPSQTYAGGPAFATNTPFPGLRVWMTHVQGTKVTLSAGKPVIPAVASPYFVTETPAALSNLGSGEKALIENLCLYDSLLSGKPCTCQLEDYDF